MQQSSYVSTPVLASFRSCSAPIKSPPPYSTRPSPMFRPFRRRVPRATVSFVRDHFSTEREDRLWPDEAVCVVLRQDARVKIVTWNAARQGLAAFNALVEQVKPDIAIVNEFGKSLAEPPSSVSSWHRFGSGPYQSQVGVCQIWVAMSVIERRRAAVDRTLARHYEGHLPDWTTSMVRWWQSSQVRIICRTVGEVSRPRPTTTDRGDADRSVRPLLS
jgi:hypothetical protein